MSNKIASQAPTILGKVASLTTIRDIEIFEFSFMKTLANMLNVNDVSLYKFNNLNQACRLIRYATDTEESGGKKRIDETKEIHIEKIVIPDEIKRARGLIESTGKAYSIKVDNDFLNIYPVYGLNNIVGYLSLTINHELSEAENFAISSLLNISQNFHSLLEENQKDKLTGLLNRKTFDDNISRIQSILFSTSHESEPYLGNENRQDRSRDEYWLSIIDIDFFKKINDTFGHVYGDEVLLMLSQEMKSNFRPHDLLFRFGGEEFIAIVKVASQEEARLSFDRFRKAIEEYEFPQVGQVTISLGATLILDENTIASDIVGRADKALYHAKDNGRNKLYFYEDLVADGMFEDKVDYSEVEFF